MISGAPAKHRALLLSVFILLGLWMLAPAFTASYVEAYVVRLHSMAILLHRGVRLGLDDQAYPINTEFLYLTRIGMVELIRCGVLLFGELTIWSVRAPVLLSFVLLGAVGVRFGRRWAEEPWWALCAMIVLTSGILESSFFLSDNLPSAALATVALLLVGGRASPLRWLGAGAMLAAATLVRLDAVLVIPMAAGVLWLAHPQPRTIAKAVLYAGLGAAVIFVLNRWATGVGLPLALNVGRTFSAANASDLYAPGLRRTADIAVGFFGLITLPCILVGLWENARRHPVRWSMVMGLLPGLFYLAFLPKANEIRDFMLLGVPFVVLHGATGLRRILQAAAAGPAPSTWAARLVLLFFALVASGPPWVISKDGPRTMMGRVYAPVFWWQWQARNAQAQLRIDQFVSSLRPGSRVLALESFFEPDRYLHLALLQRGFQIAPVQDPTHCGSVEVYTNGAATVVNLRSEVPYGLINAGRTDDQVAAMQMLASFQCIKGQRFDRIEHLAWGGVGYSFGPDQVTSHITVPAPNFPVPAFRRVTYPELQIVDWSAGDLSRAQSQATQILSTPNSQGLPIPSYAEFHEKMLGRQWDPGTSAR